LLPTFEKIFRSDGSKFWHGKKFLLSKFVYIREA
jgi:hypothetical protein